MKAVPHDIEAEQFTLGAMMLNPDVIQKARKILSPMDFFRPEHQRICKGIFETRGEPVLVKEWLSKRQLLEKVGGANYINELLANITTSAGAEHYVRRLKDLSNRRKLIQLTEKARDLAYSEHNDPEEVISNLKSDIRNMDNWQGQEDFKDTKTLVMEVFKDIEKRRESGNSFVGLPTDFKNIDDNLHGLEPGTTVYLIARPHMGKTVLGLNIVDNVALRRKGKVVYFSLESNDIALTRRRLSRQSGVFLTRIRTGEVRDDQWQNLIQAANVLSSSDLIIIDKPRYKYVEALTALSESLAVDYPLSLIVIDHIQRMRSRQKLANRHLELSLISEELSSLAKEVYVPIIILCQLSREVEKRNNPRPRLADMKESGDLEANADVVISLYRESQDSYYLELDCLKGRDTGTWKTQLKFDRYTQKIEDSEEEQKQMYGERYEL